DSVMKFPTSIIIGCVLALGWAPAAHGQALPLKVDLRPEFKKLGLTAQAQGSRDVCSLFALTGAAEFEFARAEKGIKKRFSEEYLVWAANEATGQTGDQAMFFEALHGLRELGICTTDLMPYEATTDAKRKPSDKALADAKTRSHRWGAF